MLSSCERGEQGEIQSGKHRRKLVDTFASSLPFVSETGLLIARSQTSRAAREAKPYKATLPPAGNNALAFLNIAPNSGKLQKDFPALNEVKNGIRFNATTSSSSSDQ